MSERTEYVYAACDYFATGEGRTITLMITRAYARQDLGDYEVVPSFDKDWNYNPGVLRVTPQDIALRELREHGVDKYYLQGVEFLTHDEFMDRYKQHLPEYVLRMVNAKGNDRPGNFHFFSTVHFNFS